jgi:hypothetical protein
VALNILNAFLNELNALKRSDHISAENYEALFASYSALVAGIGAETEDELVSPARPGRRPDGTEAPDDESGAGATGGDSRSPGGPADGRPTQVKPERGPNQDQGPHGSTREVPSEQAPGKGKSK